MDLQVMEKQQAELKKRLTSILLQLGIEYDQQRIEELNKKLLSANEGHQRVSYSKRLLQLEKEENELNQLIIETKQVESQLDNKIKIQKDKLEELKKEKDQCLLKIRFVEEIQKLKKQTKDLQIENQSFELFFKHIEDNVQQSLFQKFNEESQCLQKIHQRLYEEQKKIQERIHQSLQENQELKKSIEKAQEESQELRKKQQDINRQIQQTKSQNQLKKLFLDREKSRRQMQIFSPEKTQRSQKNEHKQQSSKIQLQKIQLPNHLWEKNKFYIIILGFWTVILLLYGIYSLFK